MDDTVKEVNNRVADLKLKFSMIKQSRDSTELTQECENIKAFLANYGMTV